MAIGLVINADTSLQKEIDCNDPFSLNPEKLQWIGATDAGHEGNWTWTNGAGITPSQSHWSRGEPNNCCGGQNCAVINFKKPGVWADQKCDQKLPFHCQVGKMT